MLLMYDDDDAGVVNPITNSAIHHKAVEYGVKLYEIADHLGIDDVEFFKELSAKIGFGRQLQIIDAIREIAEERN